MPIRPRSTQPTVQPVEHVFPDWGVAVFESHHAAGWRMPPAAHDFLKIVLVHDGVGSLRRGPDATECRRGDALVIPAGHSHEICDSESEPLSLYVVSIRSRVLELACFDTAVLSTGVVHLDPHTAEKVERSMRRLLFEQTLDTPTTGAQMIALALRLIADLTRRVMLSDTMQVRGTLPFVAATHDPHPVSLIAQPARQGNKHRCLTCPANGQATHHNHGNAVRSAPFVSRAGASRVDDPTDGP